MVFVNSRNYSCFCRHLDWNEAGKEAATGNFYENDIHFITAVRSHGDCINKGGQVMSVVLKKPSGRRAVQILSWSPEKTV